MCWKWRWKNVSKRQKIHGKENIWNWMKGVLSLFSVNTVCSLHALGGIGQIAEIHAHGMLLVCCARKWSCYCNKHTSMFPMYNSIAIELDWCMLWVYIRSILGSINMHSEIWSENRPAKSNSGLTKEESGTCLKTSRKPSEEQWAFINGCPYLWLLSSGQIGTKDSSRVL
jgi:hypothetical protein